MTLKQLLTATALVSLTFMASPTLVGAANPSLATGMDAKEIQQVEVDGVTVENFAGQVIIKSTGKDKTARVSLKGSDDLLKQVIVTDNFASHKGKLYIAFDKDAPVLKDMSLLTLTLEVPPTMPLTLSLVGGKADIGDRASNDTKINLNGFGDIRISSLKNIESNIDGSGEITIMNIAGDANIAIRGDGKYLIQKGTIPNLKASIQGTGVIDIKSSVQNAEVRCEGAGNMNLATVTGNLKQSTSGAGAISISRIEGSFKNNVSGTGELEMNCGKPTKKKKI